MNIQDAEMSKKVKATVSDDDVKQPLMTKIDVDDETKNNGKQEVEVMKKKIQWTSSKMHLGGELTSRTKSKSSEDLQLTTGERERQRKDALEKAPGLSIKQLSEMMKNVKPDFKTDPNKSKEENDHKLLTNKNAVKEFVVLLEKIFPEIPALASEVNETPEGEKKSNPYAISNIVHGTDAIEYDKVQRIYDRDADMRRRFFRKLRQYVFHTKLKDNQELIEALIVFTVINDLGKVESVVQRVRARTAVEELDHDKILYSGLKLQPDMFKSYQRLSLSLQDCLLKGLEAQFNFAQFVQGENLPANLNGLRTLTEESEETLDLFNLHALFDMAGAAPGVSAYGSIVFTEATYHDIKMAIESVETIVKGASVPDVYVQYLHLRGKLLGLNAYNTTQQALIRLCCMSRFHTRQEGRAMILASKKIPRETWEMLRKELCVAPNGRDANYTKMTPEEKLTKDAEILALGLETMARCFKLARDTQASLLDPVEGPDCFVANINAVAAKANTPSKLADTQLGVKQVGEDINITAK